MDNEELAAQLARIEQKLDWIVGQLAQPAQPVGPTQLATGGAGLTAEEQMYADAGKLIQAIKMYRQRTGVGLREAKRTVEQLARRT